MKKEAYDKFMKKISSEFKNVDTVKEFLLDAAELAMYTCYKQKDEIITHKWYRNIPPSPEAACTIHHRSLIQLSRDRLKPCQA